jgi:hypothetical protein
MLLLLDDLMGLEASDPNELEQKAWWQDLPRADQLKLEEVVQQLNNQSKWKSCFKISYFVQTKTC